MATMAVGKSGVVSDESSGVSAHRISVAESAVDKRKTAILYFGNDWFAENRTSSHHVARCLAQRYDVFYVECPGLRAPKGSARDLRRIGQKLWRFLKGAQPVDQGLKVQTLLQIPLHRFAIVRWLNQRLIKWTMAWLMWRHAVQRPILWFVVPHVATLSGTLGESLAVYYCIDDYAALPDVDAETVLAMDNQLTADVDLVFVASDTLLAAKTSLNADTHLSPHGVDVQHFGRVRATQMAPADISILQRPIVGFFGLIEQWIDLDLVRYLAEQRPQFSFVMIGRVAVDDDAVPKLPNIHFLGRRRYEELPSYGSQFDATIIPYKLTRQVLHANPLKLREYLAMGKAVVSVSTPEIEKYADVVHVAHSREEFLAKLDAVLSEGESEEAVQQRIARVAQESWEARIEQVLEVVQRRLESEPCTTRQPAEAQL